MLLSDEELARLDSAEPFLREEARRALPAGSDYEIIAELRDHLQPGLRIRARDVATDTQTPPYPLDLFVGLPLDEIRYIANSADAARDAAIVRLGAAFAARLRRAIAMFTPHQIDLDAGVQSSPGTLAVILDPAP